MRRRSDQSLSVEVMPRISKFQTLFPTLHSLGISRRFQRLKKALAAATLRV